MVISTKNVQLLEDFMRTNSAVTIMIRHLIKDASHIAWIIFAKAFHVDSSEFHQIKLHLYARAIGSAVGQGTLGRNVVVARGEPLPNQLMAFQRKAATIAESAASALGLEHDDPLYKAFLDEVWISALAGAVASGRFKAPQP